MADKHGLTKEDARRGGLSSAKTRRTIARLERELGKMGLTSDLVSDLKDVVVEVIRATQAHPLMGVAVALIVTNVLYRIGVISASVFTLIVTIVAGSAGVTIVGDLLSDVLPFSGGSPNSDLVKPTPTTLSQTHAEGGKSDRSAGGNAVKAMVAQALGQLPAVVAAAA